MRPVLRPLLLAAALTATAASAVHAQQTPAHREAIAAGYKASFLCSGVFDAGRTPAQVEADELSRPYPEYREILPRLQAKVDMQARTVSVPFAKDLPPRVAAWRPGLGCAQLPIGAAPETVSLLAKLEATPAVADAAASTQAWPMGDAKAERKLSAGRAKALDAVVAAAFDHKSYGEATETTAVLIVQDGKIVAERYRDGFDLHTPQRTWSAAKSVTGTLVGIAVRQGMLDVNKPATIPEWGRPGDPRAAITLADLLHMGSGLYSEAAGNRTDMIYFGGTTVTEKATAMPLEAAPGRRWRYANDDTLLTVRALRAAIGDDKRYLAYPFQELFWKIGMRHTTPETDWAGNFILSSQVWTTSRDMARLGLLYLNDGVWNGERILPEGWAAYVATPAPAQPENAVTGNGVGYGAQFWIFGPKQGLPEGTYAARGSQGQLLMIVPSQKLLVVRRGFDGLGGEKQFEEAKFTADVIAALGAAQSR